MSDCRGPRDLCLALLLVLTVAVTTGCQESPGQDSSGPPVTEPATGPGSRGPASAAADTVRVGLTEWKIVTSALTVPPGAVELGVTNAGATEHDLVVEGRDGTWRTEDLVPGAVQTLAVRARPGETLKLWCSEPGHEVQGMHTTLRVTS